MQPAPAAETKLRLAQEDIHEQWEGDYLNRDLDRFYDAAFDRILSTFGDTRGKSLLDIGCGYCHHTMRLVKGGLQITATDFSEVPLEHARKVIAGHEDQVTLQQADATYLPFDAKTFDFVLFWGVLMHIPDAKKALSEVARVLKPGGKLALSEVNRNSLDVRIVEQLVNVARSLLGKGARERNRTALGIEEWHVADQGRLVVRKTDMAALEAYCKTIGLRLEQRFAGQFTETYTRVPSRPLKRAIYGFNQWWFERNGSPALAVSNILIFRKV